MRSESVPAEPPIIVGGCFRSGTSLVRRLLNSHSRIHCGPEVKFFRDFTGDYIDDRHRHLRFFTTVRGLGLDDAMLLDLFGRAFIEAHRAAARSQGKPRWADKSPENVLYMDAWWRLLNGQLRFVHCVRHPIDTLASLKEAGFPLTVPSRFEDKVSLWRRYVEAGLAFEEAHRQVSFRLRYEDLATATEPTLRRLMAFLGEQFEPQQLNFNSLPHQPGLEDPKVAQTQAVHARSVGRGAASLDPLEVAAVRMGAAPLASRLDYDLG
jgi:Sulfotransferase family